MRFIRERSSSTQPLRTGTRDPQPQFFPPLTGYSGTRNRLAMRRQSCTSALDPGQRIAGMRWVVAKVAVSAAARTSSLTHTKSAPRHCLQASMAPVRSTIDRYPDLSTWHKKRPDILDNRAHDGVVAEVRNTL